MVTKVGNKNKVTTVPAAAAAPAAAVEPTRRSAREIILSMSLKHLNTIQSVKGENGHVNSYVNMISIILE